MDRPWIVLKYGGTSVATAERWATIAARVRQLLPTHRVWVTVSALSQVSNLLERAIAEALAGRPVHALDEVSRKHAELADALGLDDDDRAPVDALLATLRNLLDGVALVQEASPRLRARVMSFGELASSQLGAAWLAKQGLSVQRVDARRLLTTDPAPGTPDATRHLDAHVAPRRDVAAAEALADGADVVLTQGFIAATPAGHTCLLGRGGSDTSAGLFAALLGAERLEIWTDVHGLFTTDPRVLPSARLIQRLRYREAQELATMGAKVLHPRCLAPAAFAGIPVEIRNTRDPDAPCTRIAVEGDAEPTVLAVVARRGVPLVSVETLAMWGAPGFLARIFGAFAAHGISIDLVATSESSVSVTLDHVPDGLRGDAFAALLADLRAIGDVTVKADAAVVSLVGRRIRTVLHRLGDALGVLEEKRVHLVSASAEDLNLSFVVDAEDAGKLVRDLHSHLLGAGVEAPWLGPTWAELTGSVPPEVPRPPRWWEDRVDDLLREVADGAARYVYDLATVRARAAALRARLPHVAERFYAIKANNHPDVLRALADEGMGMECVSLAEVQHVRDVLGPDVPVLFTPNFCPIPEYAGAYALGAEVTVDGPDVLRQAPQVFRSRDVALRIDPGGGRGHHDKVKTAGAGQKFGHPLSELDAFLALSEPLGCRVIGLHAHVGSGILDPIPWSRTARLLGAARARLPHLGWIDLGGGLGVVERTGQAPLDLDAMDAAIAAVDGLDGLRLRIEPGRYLVSEAGVLLIPVTQVRTKDGATFVGGATGMNSLIRPALYGAWHDIHNLSRWDEPATTTVEVVGPICETGDVLGHDRRLPPTQPGDVLLVDNAGAYGAVMGSRYNLRDPAAEVVLG